MPATGHTEGAGRPLVSVVIPVRDGEVFLDRALGSVVGQTFRDFEVVVVDDGSTDGTAAIVARFAGVDSRVRYVEATGSGVAAARNQGMALARGTFVAPLDADDLWLPTKLERQVARAAEAGDDVSLVYCWTYLIDADDRILAISRPFDERTMRSLEGDVFLPLAYKAFFANGSNPLIRTRFLEQVGGYDPALARREDWDLSLRLAARSEFALVPAFLVAYRQLPASRSHAPSELLESHARILERVAQDDGPLPHDVVRWSRSECFAYAAARAGGSGHSSAALRLFGRALALDPGQVLRPAPWRTLASRVARRRRDGVVLDLAHPPADDQFPMRPRGWPGFLPTPFELLERRRFRRLRRAGALRRRTT